MIVLDGWLLFGRLFSGLFPSGLGRFGGGALNRFVGLVADGGGGVLGAGSRAGVAARAAGAGPLSAAPLLLLLALSPPADSPPVSADASAPPAPARSSAAAMAPAARCVPALTIPPHQRQDALPGNIHDVG